MRKLSEIEHEIAHVAHDLRVASRIRHKTDLDDEYIARLELYIDELKFRHKNGEKNLYGAVPQDA